MGLHPSLGFVPSLGTYRHWNPLVSVQAVPQNEKLRIQIAGFPPLRAAQLRINPYAASAPAPAPSDGVETEESRTEVAESEPLATGSESAGENQASTTPHAADDHASVEEYGTGGGDDDGNDGDDGNGSGGYNNDRGHHHEDGGKSPLTTFLTVGDSAKRTLGVVWKWFAAAAVRLFNVIPAQIITTLLGLLSGYAAHRRSTEVEKRRIEMSKEAEVKAERDRVEKELRQKYQRMHGPLLKAACKLSERLFVLVSGAESARWDDGDEPYPPALYTAYLLGRYLGLVEIMKRQSHQVMDLGYPAADRIFLNILGRIQGVLAADDSSLLRLQETEAYFKPAPGEIPVPGGPFRVSSRNQSAIGELMLRREGMDERFSDEGTAADAVLTFCEFAKRMQSDVELQKWFNPVVRDLESLQNCGQDAKSRAKIKNAKKLNVSNARADGRALIGSRPYFLQCALQDLLDFLVRIIANV